MQGTHTYAAGEVTAEGNFGPIDAVDAGIAARAAACDKNLQTGHKTEIHKMFGDGLGHVKVFEDSALAEGEIGKSVARFGGGRFHEGENHFQYQFYCTSLLIDLPRTKVTLPCDI
jgi:hypothetical protein